VTQRNSLATRGRLRLHAEILDGVAALRAETAALQSLAVRCDAPVTGCLPWMLASAEAALAMTTADRLWAVVLRDDDAVPRAAAVLLESWTATGPVLRLAGAEGGYRSRLLAVDDDAAAALAEAVLDRLHDRPTPVTVSLGPLPALDPVVERLCMALQEWSVDGSAEVPVVRRSGPPEATEYLTSSVRRTLRKVGNRLRSDGVRSEVSFTRERHRIIALLPGMSLAYHDRDEAHGVVEDAFDDAPGWPLFAARMRALAGQAGVEVATLTLDGQLAAYVVGFDDGRAYRVMDGRFVSAWARYSPGRLLETAVLQRMLDDPAKQTLDWMTSIAPESLLGANATEPVATLRATVHPYSAAPHSQPGPRPADLR
jgi:CelD/BcsL family acetyltransferase involved in cellulose biosynthesis